MRLIFGMILGIALTLGVAYFNDTYRASPAATTPAERPMVNWDSVNENVKIVTARARAEWDKLMTR
jgi:hypothetical protein